MDDAKTAEVLSVEECVFFDTVVLFMVKLTSSGQLVKFIWGYFPIIAIN